MIVIRRRISLEQRLKSENSKEESSPEELHLTVMISRYSIAVPPP